MSIPDFIASSTFYSKTTKEQWDNLHLTYQSLGLTLPDLDPSNFRTHSASTKFFDPVTLRCALQNDCVCSDYESVFHICMYDGCGKAMHVNCVFDIDNFSKYIGILKSNALIE